MEETFLIAQLDWELVSHDSLVLLGLDCLPCPTSRQRQPHLLTLITRSHWSVWIYSLELNLSKRSLRLQLKTAKAMKTVLVVGKSSPIAFFVQGSELISNVPGANRGIGLHLIRTFKARGWHTIGSVRPETFNSSDPSIVDVSRLAAVHLCFISSLSKPYQSFLTRYS